MEKKSQKGRSCLLLSTLSSAVCCLSCFHCWDRLKRSWIYWIGGAEERIEKEWGILQVRSQTVTRSLELLTGHFQQLLDLFNLNVSRSIPEVVCGALPLYFPCWVSRGCWGFSSNSTQPFHTFLSCLILHRYDDTFTIFIKPCWGLSFFPCCLFGMSTILACFIPFVWAKRGLPFCIDEPL